MDANTPNIGTNDFAAEQPVLAEIDRQTRPEQEIRLFPSTYNTASVGGFISASTSGCRTRFSDAALIPGR